MIDSESSFSSRSSKYQFKVAERHLLGDFCTRTGVDYGTYGKPIIGASQAIVEDLARIYQIGVADGVKALQFHSGRAVSIGETDGRATAAPVSAYKSTFDRDSFLLSSCRQSFSPRTTLPAIWMPFALSSPVSGNLRAVRRRGGHLDHNQASGERKQALRARTSPVDR